MLGLFKLAFLLFKFAKLGKVLLTVGSMLLMVWVYQMQFGWRFSVGFVLLLFIHEMGHYIAAKQKGLNVGAPVFIPFIGAYIALKELPHNVETEAYVALAGPVAGTLGALVFYYFGYTNQDPLMLALSYAGFFLNLFNLIPLSPLDGGRISAVLTPRIWLVGYPILIAFFIYHPSPLLIVIGIIGLPSLAKAWKYNPHDPANAIYYQIAPRKRAFYAGSYLLLAGFLAIMTTSLDQTLRG